MNKNLKNKEKIEDTLIKMIRSFLICVIVAAINTVPVFAAGGRAEIVALLQDFINILGLAIGAWGALQLILSFVNDNPQTRASSVGFLAAGLGVLLVGSPLIGLLA